jgi:TonB dependent receptor-like, beta-barrel/Carboxypeptidase regulatory-like domain
MKMVPILCTSLLLALMIPRGGAAQGSASKRTFHLEDSRLRDAIDSLMLWYSVPILYLDRDVRGARVTVICKSCVADEALTRVLQGTGLVWRRIGSQFMLQKRSSSPEEGGGTIAGTVVDTLTGEWIAGASVLLQDSIEDPVVRRWCITNQFGFFSLRNVKPGAYLLAVRSLGYTRAGIPILMAAGSSVRKDITMLPQEIRLQEVTIEGHRTPFSAAEGLSRGIYIRSTPSDQDQYLLDGARIYNPAHLGGVLSTFNEDALNDVQLKVGGVPPSYGGRIGGVMDISLREGAMERLSGSVGSGTMGSFLTLEGPAGSQTSFLVSGRRGYPDIIVPHLEEGRTANSLHSSEVIAKLSHRLSENDRFSVSGYFGRDSYTNTVGGGGAELDNGFSWGNASANVRWIGIVSPSLFLHAAAVYTRYDFSARHSLRDDTILMPGTPLNSDYSIEDISVRAQAEHYYDENHTVRGGVELLHHRLNGTISPFSSQIAGFSFPRFSAWELSVYVQDQWRLLPGVTADVGARVTSFVGEDATFSGVDPRFSLLVSPDDEWRLYTSLTAINQFVHPYRNSGIFLYYPTIFWYPSDAAIRPSTSLQVSLGTEKLMGEGAYVVSAESYYRITRNLHEFAFDTTAALSAGLDDVVLFGSGKVYGGAVTLRKRTGSLTGWLSYNLSWTTHTFKELNDGKPFFPRFDRRHELQAAAWYTPTSDWVFGVLCVLASDQSPSFSPKVSVARNALQPAELIDMNGSRLPGFQRFEVRVLHRFSSWGMPLQVSLRLLNSYGLFDPIEWELSPHDDIRLKWNAGLREQRVFPLYPTLGLSMRF